MTTAAFTLRPWLLSIRVPTLTAALVPVFAATCLLIALHYAVSPAISVFALVAALFIQVGTNLFNDALDFVKGADTEERLGPTRAAQAGWISVEKIKIAAVACFVLALVFCIPLVARAGWPIAVLGAVSLLFGYAYTGGPFPLAYVGLGELFVILFFGLAAVMGTAFVQAQTLSLPFFVAGLQIGCLAAVLIALNNFRDSRSDARAGKRTLSVRLGATFSRSEITIFALLPFALGGFFWKAGLPGAALLPCSALPMAIRLVVSVWKTEPGREYNSLLKRGALLHLLFGILFSLGCLFL